MAQKQLTVERGLYNELEQDFHQSLSVEQALLHLNNERTMTRLPFRPKHGNLYLFFNPTRPDDWRADGHKWANQGTTKLPWSTKLIKKTYFYIASENGYDKRFRKEVFMRNEEGSPVLIHYIAVSLIIPGYPRTLQDSIICMFNILYERVDDGLVLVCWCINQIILTDQFGWMENGRTRPSMTMLQIIELRMQGYPRTAGITAFSCLSTK